MRARFSDEERHRRRLDKIADVERQYLAETAED